MHSENASAGGIPALVAEVVLAALDADVVAPARDAAIGLLAPAPHPATRTTGTTLSSAVALSRSARRDSVSGFGWILSCIWSP
jgi:hypothetical protein